MCFGSIYMKPVGSFFFFLIASIIGFYRVVYDDFETDIFAFVNAFGWAVL